MSQKIFPVKSVLDSYCIYENKKFIYNGRRVLCPARRKEILQMKKRDRILFLLMNVILGMAVFSANVTAKTLDFGVTGQCRTAQKATIVIQTNDGEYNGFDIFRSETEGGDYQQIGTVGDYYNLEESDDYANVESFEMLYDNQDYQIQYTYEDPAILNVNQTYYYQVKAYVYLNGTKVYQVEKNIQITVLGEGPAITYGKRYGKLGVRLKWSKVDDADGYDIYAIADYDEKSNWRRVDEKDLSGYELIKTVNSDTFSATFKNRMNGVTYTYRVCSYKKVNGTKIPSVMSAPKDVVMNYYSYDNENYNQRIKRAFGSQKAMKKNYKTSSKAAKQMKRIKIKVWDYKSGKKGKKVTKTKWLTVNKKLAPSISQMFKELYASKEKQVIHDIGCYSYRTGEHMYGMAIDINPNENYMIDKVKGKKKILAGKYWKPKKDPYSIPNDSEFVKIMSRYGFYRGDWGDRKDYMHFSYFGT